MLGRLLIHTAGWAIRTLDWERKCKFKSERKTKSKAEAFHSQFVFICSP